MILVISLLLVGFFLIFLEFFLPGGIVGAVGAIFLLLSIAFFVKETSSPLAISLFLLFLGILLFLLIKFTLLVIKRTKKKGSIYLEGDQGGFLASTFDKTMIGKKGVAFSDLKPSGHILIENRKFQALSKSGYIRKGTLLEVVGGRGAYLIVRTSNRENDDIHGTTIL